MPIVDFNRPGSTRPWKPLSSGSFHFLLIPFGEIFMAQTTVKAVPVGMHTITAHLVCAGASEAIDFYKKAFGALELMRLHSPDGKIMHARLQIGDSQMMIVDEYPEWGSLGPTAFKGTPVTIHLQVENADAIAAQAAAAGAKIIMPVGEAFWGDRYGVLEDPFGHKWSVGTNVKVMTPEEIMAAMKTSCP